MFDPFNSHVIKKLFVAAQGDEVGIWCWFWQELPKRGRELK